jgi:hypothetical protein
VRAASLTSTAFGQQRVPPIEIRKNVLKKIGNTPEQEAIRVLNAVPWASKKTRRTQARSSRDVSPIGYFLYVDFNPNERNFVDGPGKPERQPSL